MPALADPATWRSHPYTYTGYLYVDRPETVFAALVNQTSFSYPIVEVAYDTVTTGAFGDIEVGQTVLFGTSAGADDLGRQRVRKAADATKIYFGESSRGVFDGEVDLGNNIFITVLNDRRVWVIPPRFDPDTTTHYKDYEIPITEAGRNYGSRPGPVANGGPWRVALFDSGASIATFDFDGTDSFGMSDTNGAVASYLWDVQDGTITVGVATDSAITATFPAGRRYVTLTVTDGNGDTHTTYILVVVLGLDEATWKPIRQFEITEHRLTRDGARMRFIIHEDLAPTTYPNGAAVLYFESEVYNGTAGSLAGPSTVEHVKFVGWHDTITETPTATLQGIQNGVEFGCISAFERFKQVNLLPMLVESATSPSDWTEMSTLTVGRFLFYLVRWHSTLFETAPVDPVSNNLARAYPGLRADATTLFDMTKEFIDSTGNIMTCDQRGILRILANPQLEAVTDRIATEIVSLTSADMSAVTVQQRNSLEVYWIQASGIIVGGPTRSVFARAPGLAPGQGASRWDIGEQLVATQAELNTRTGNIYGQRNSKWLPLELQMYNTGDAGVDPALAEWVPVTLAATTNRRGLSLTGERTLPVEVRIQHSNDARKTKDVTYVLEIETEAEDSAVTIKPEPSTEQPKPPEDDFPIPVSPDPPADPLYLHRGIKNIAFVDDQGYLYTTTDYDVHPDAGGPTYSRVNLSMSGTPISFAVDPFSPLYLGTGSTVNAWVATSQRIYKISDLFNTSPTVTSQVTFANATPGNGHRAIAASFGNYNSNQAWLLCVSHYINTAGHTGTWAIKSQDAGATWNAEQNITVHYDTAAQFYHLGVYASPKTAGKAYTAAFTNTANPPTADGYVSSDYGVTWAQISNPDILPVNGLGGDIHVPWSSNPNERYLYHGAITKGAALQFRLKRIALDGTTKTDISPSDGSRNYGLNWYSFSVRTYDPNRRYVVMAGYANDVDLNGNNNYHAVFVSDDYGDNWTQIVTEIIQSSGTFPLAAAFAGNTEQIIYLWGTDGYMAYTQDFGATVLDKMGNLGDFSVPAVGLIIGIAGG